MTNWQPEQAIEYHEATKHWPGAVSSHRVPAAIIPRKYKLYQGLDAVPLPEQSRSTLSAVSVLADGAKGADASLDLPRLASLLHFSAGITRRVKLQGREMEFRAASCTGALYHIETYVVTGGLPGLDAGVYHFGVHDNALRLLRVGDYRGVIRDALCQPAEAAMPQAYLVHTSTWWRNAWRYEDRAYRHTFWDAGTIVANLAAVAAAQGIDATLSLAFWDEPVNALLSVDPRKEAAVSIVAIGGGPDFYPDDAAGFNLRHLSSLEPTASLPVVALSPVEIEYPMITSLHEASSLLSCDEVEHWRDVSIEGSDNRAAQDWHYRRLKPAASGKEKPESIESVIERRGSGRRFRQRGISEQELSTVLQAASRKLDADFVDGRASLIEPFLIVNAVEGLVPGAYAYDASTHGLVLIREGDFREAAGHLALDQALAAEAAVNVYFLSALRPILERLGNRGYRAAQMESGIRGGRVYLSAYALGLRATGLTFYDDEVIEFFGEAAAGKDVMFLVAFGR